MNDLLYMRLEKNTFFLAREIEIYMQLFIFQIRFCMLYHI